MDTIVKYRFDREMVAFVKTLDIKTAMFGYDKNDVYSKIKDLLVRARDVCQDLVAEENEKFEAIKASLLQVADDPEAVRALLYAWDAGSGSIDAKEPEEALSEASPDLPKPEDQALAARLEELEARQELLDRAHDIVSEARLEREEIIRKAQTMAEEELFLYRAKRRDEEAEFLAELEGLEAQKADLEAACDRYRGFVMKGQSLFGLFQNYASEIDAIQGDELMSEIKEDRPVHADDLDPPVLSTDHSMACTEESMPLCELAEESPEGIFLDLAAPQSQVPQDNEPLEGGPQVGCQGGGDQKE